MNSLVFWFTGLSGAGKSTIADAARRQLEDDGCRVLILDGDDIRGRLHRHLGFSDSDIKENNRLISELCAERRAEVDVIMVPIISPFRASRLAARQLLSPGFFEVYVEAQVDTVMARDVKGLYSKARAGEIGGMIGVSPDAVPYEAPLNADLVISSDATPAAEAIAAMTGFVRQQLGKRSA